MISIAIPKLGLTMERAKLVRWNFSSGKEVREGDGIFVIETDKVTYEVPAAASGFIHPVVPEGRECAVEEVVGYIAENREEYARIVAQHPLQTREEEAEAAPGPERAQITTARAGALRVKSSPLARAMAEEHGLNLGSIRGTGPGGRIVRADILRALEHQARTAAKRIEGLNEPSEKEIGESIPISGVRKIIFENMHMSLSQSAQLTLHTEASAEALVALRNRLSTAGEKISYNAILLKTVATALRLHPRMNASVEDGAIKVWKQVHIGLAMEADEALIVSVVRRPDTKTIYEIEREIGGLILKIRQKRLSPDDLVDGTFTVTNLGFSDIDHFTPIIRPPESAILGIGRILRKPVVAGEDIVPQHRLGLSLTFDHRIIDGAPAARFLTTVKDMIEDPLLLIR